MQKEYQLQSSWTKYRFVGFLFRIAIIYFYSSWYFFKDSWWYPIPAGKNHVQMIGLFDHPLPCSSWTCTRGCVPLWFDEQYIIQASIPLLLHPDLFRSRYWEKYSLIDTLQNSRYSEAVESSASLWVSTV